MYHYSTGMPPNMGMNSMGGMGMNSSMNGMGNMPSGMGNNMGGIGNIGMGMPNNMANNMGNNMNNMNNVAMTAGTGLSRPGTSMTMRSANMSGGVNMVRLHLWQTLISSLLRFDPRRIELIFASRVWESI